MIWIILIIVALIIIPFLISFNKDNDDLYNQSLNEKFSVIVSMINDAAHSGQGSIEIHDNRSFSLYQDETNQIINFLYSSGSLTITWKYKYFQEEMVHEKMFTNVRNLSLFEQRNIAESVISEMEIKVSDFKYQVNKQF